MMMMIMMMIMMKTITMIVIMIVMMMVKYNNTFHVLNIRDVQLMKIVQCLFLAEKALVSTV